MIDEEFLDEAKKEINKYKIDNELIVKSLDILKILLKERFDDISYRPIEFYSVKCVEFILTKKMMETLTKRFYSRLSIFVTNERYVITTENFYISKIFKKRVTIESDTTAKAYEVSLCQNNIKNIIRYNIFTAFNHYNND